MKELDDLPTPDFSFGNGERTRGWQNHVTESEVREAVRVFKAKGGIIKMLPNEFVLPNQLVGWKHSQYETIKSQWIGIF